VRLAKNKNIQVYLTEASFSGAGPSTAFLKIFEGNSFYLAIPEELGKLIDKEINMLYRLQKYKKNFSPSELERIFRFKKIPIMPDDIKDPVLRKMMMHLREKKSIIFFDDLTTMVSGYANDHNGIHLQMMDDFEQANKFYRSTLIHEVVHNTTNKGIGADYDGRRIYFLNSKMAGYEDYLRADEIEARVSQLGSMKKEMGFELQYTFTEKVLLDMREIQLGKLKALRAYLSQPAVTGDAAKKFALTSLDVLLPDGQTKKQLLKAIDMRLGYLNKLPITLSKLRADKGSLNLLSTQARINIESSGSEQKKIVLQNMLNAAGERRKTDASYKHLTDDKIIQNWIDDGIIDLNFGKELCPQPCKLSNPKPTKQNP
jgi:hypothetical protein